MAQFFNKAVLTNTGVALLATAKATRRKLNPSWRVALGAGKVGDMDVTAFTALLDERLSCPMQSVKPAKGELVVKAIVDNTNLVKTFTAREMGLFADDALFAYTYLDVGADDIPDKDKGLDTSIIEFAVELDDTLVEPAYNPNAVITDEDYDSVKVDLSKVVATIEHDLSTKLEDVPNIPIRVNGSTQADINSTVKANNASGNLLSAKRGIAAGTYKLTELLQALVKASHSHNTVGIANSGPGNCNCNCKHLNCAPNCKQCVNCTQCKTIYSGNCITHEQETISFPLATTDNIEHIPGEVPGAHAYACSGVAPGDGLFSLVDADYWGEYHRTQVNIAGQADIDTQSICLYCVHRTTPRYSCYVKKGDKYWFGTWVGHNFCHNCNCAPERHSHVKLTFTYIK